MIEISMNNTYNHTMKISKWALWAGAAIFLFAFIAAFAQEVLSTNQTLAPDNSASIVPASDILSSPAIFPIQAPALVRQAVIVQQASDGTISLQEIPAPTAPTPVSGQNPSTIKP
jgi:hypothetical protein